MVKPGDGLSTAEIYKQTDSEKNLIRPDNAFLIKCIKEKNYTALAENMKNVMEQVSIKQIPEIQIIKSSLLENGAKGAMMSGSGSCVFGLFLSKQAANEAAKKLKSSFQNFFVFSAQIL